MLMTEPFLEATSRLLHGVWVIRSLIKISACMYLYMVYREESSLTHSCLITMLTQACVIQRLLKTGGHVQTQLMIFMLTCSMLRRDGLCRFLKTVVSFV